jgi:hypothetical protein
MSDNRREKPPLGIQPRYLWLEERCDELSRAISRNRQRGFSVPGIWERELKALEKEIVARQEYGIMTPTDQQKAALITQLDAMPSDQWNAMTRWMVDRIVSDDQTMAMVILFNEAQRRMESHNANRVREQHATLDHFLSEVFRDVGVKLSLV